MDESLHGGLGHEARFNPPQTVWLLACSVGSAAHSKRYDGGSKFFLRPQVSTTIWNMDVCSAHVVNTAGRGGSVEERRGGTNGDIWDGLGWWSFTGTQCAEVAGVGSVAGMSTWECVKASVSHRLVSCSVGFGGCGC